MLESRDLKRDVAALVLSAIALFLAAALFTYDPADPPTTHVYPPNGEVRNLCGPAGAFVARLLFEGLGLGAYFLMLSVPALAYVLFAHKPIDGPWLRGAGWALALVAVSTLAALAAPAWSPGPVIGSGGYLGAMTHALLEMHVASVGAYVLALSALGAGLLLATDYLLLRASGAVMRPTARGFGRGLASAGRAYSQRRQGRDNHDKETSGSGRVSVRIGGKVMTSTVDDELEEDDEPGEEDAGDEPENEAGGKAEQEDETEDESTSAPLVVKPRARANGGLRVTATKTKPELDAVIQSLNAVADNTEEDLEYELPSIDMLQEGEDICFEEHEKEVRRKAKILEKTFANFGFNVRVVEIETGPVIAQFEVELEAGLRLSKITSLADDIAIALRVPSVRIVAPIPGKNTVGIEVPNAERQVVRLREAIEEANGKVQKMKIPIYLGKDVSGNPMVVDLAAMPHLLIAGRTGTGKSVCLNSMIISMLMTRRPDEVRMLMIDPKMVELSPYKRLPHLMHPVVTDMRKAEAILAWAVEKMEERYALLARAGVRHISGYNQLGEEELMDRLQPESEEERLQIPTHLPYIVIIADEMADLMMTSAKEVETHIIRLAQKSRAVGIHLVLATQKPTVDVITGLIKSNLPARICFQVASRTDSRVVLDEMGADKLLGNGDLLFLWPGTSTLIRGQGTYVSDDEINRIVDFVGTTEPEFVKELVQLKAAPAGEGAAEGLKHRDELYEAAVDIVIREGRGSVSLLQRALGVGYGRAARLVDFMAEDGIVGAYNGSQARDVLMTLEDWQAMVSGESAAPVPAAPVASQPKQRRNRIVVAEPIRRDLDVDEDDEDADDDSPPFNVDDEDEEEPADDEQGATDDYDEGDEDGAEGDEYDDEVEEEDDELDEDELDNSDEDEREAAELEHDSPAARIRRPRRGPRGYRAESA